MKSVYKKYFHGEKTSKYFDQCDSFHFGGIGQVTDTTTNFWSMN